MFSPRLRPLKGHERSYDSYKMNRIFIYCTELNLRMSVLSLEQYLNYVTMRRCITMYLLVYIYQC